MQQRVKVNPLYIYNIISHIYHVCSSLYVYIHYIMVYNYIMYAAGIYYASAITNICLL